MMKKALAILMTLAMLLACFAGCQNTAPAPEPTATAEPQPTEIPFVGAMPGDDFENGAVGMNGAVSSSTPYASQIGLDILKKGGNAIDAAVAMIYAIGLTEPAASGMGGAGQMVIYLADEQRVVTLEYMTMAPGAAKVGLFNGSESYGPKAIAIPGIVHGTMTALEKYGTMTPAEVLQPVIDLARNGFEITTAFNERIDSAYARVSQYDYTMSLITDEGVYYTPGAIAKNNDLADTLQLIADGGKEAFYDSEFTDKLCDYIQSLGGVLTREDFAQYTTVEREPISTTYRGYNVYTVGGPSNGGGSLLQMLNIMDNYDLASLGHDSAETVKITSQAFSIAAADGFAYYADPDYYNLPIDTLVSKEYAAERAKLIPASGINKVPKRGDLTVTLTETGEKMLAGTTAEQGGTSHLSVMDGAGNVVSTTNTNGVNFGTGIAVPGTGFCFNAHLRNLSYGSGAGVNALMPYIRVRSTICPTIVTDADNKPVLSVGSPGNWALVEAVGIAISNYIDFGMNVCEAINAARSYTDTSTATDITIETRYGTETIEALKAMGFKPTAEHDYSSAVGCVAAISRDADGTLRAGADHRRLYMSYAY